jgi:hypothetical protein
VSLLLRYQKKLAALLDEGATPDAIRAALLADPDLAPLHAYVRDMDDRALEVATQLRRTWGRAHSP